MSWRDVYDPVDFMVPRTLENLVRQRTVDDLTDYAHDTHFVGPLGLPLEYEMPHFGRVFVHPLSSGHDIVVALFVEPNDPTERTRTMQRYIVTTESDLPNDPFNPPRDFDTIDYQEAVGELLNRMAIARAEEWEPRFDVRVGRKEWHP